MATPFVLSAMTRNTGGLDFGGVQLRTRSELLFEINFVIVEPLDQLVFRDFPSGTVVNDFCERVDVFRFIERVFEVHAMLIEKSNRCQCACALVAINEGVALYKVKAKSACDLCKSAMNERIISRIKSSGNRAVDFSRVYTVMCISPSEQMSLFRSITDSTVGWKITLTSICPLRVYVF